jgi:SAM-dependent methyltransferase
MLAEHGYEVVAIDVAACPEEAAGVWPVVRYDGVRIPFPDRSFDIVFSSNTLEHIPGVEQFQAEIHRVLRTDGVAVHVIPTASWRFWTNLGHFIRYFLPAPAHGEHAANSFTEMLSFSRWRWNRLFQHTSRMVRTRDVNRLFYTGCSLADRHLSIPARVRLSGYLGSSCHVYVLTRRQP